MPLAALLLLIGCKNTSTSASDSVDAAESKVETIPSQLSTDSIAYADSAAVADASIIFRAGGQYPKGATAQADSIRVWLAENLGATSNTPAETSNLNNGNSLLATIGKAYIKASRNNVAEGTPGCEYTANFSPLCITDNYVTYSFSSYDYEGGAHGMPLLSFRTFDNKGQSLTTDQILKKDKQKAVMEIIITALFDQYFTNDANGLYTDAASFREWILGYNNGQIGLPSESPVFTPMGLRFQYQAYEIAPYAAGAPYCIVSYTDLQSFLTPEAQALAIQ